MIDAARRSATHDADRAPYGAVLLAMAAVTLAGTLQSTGGVLTPIGLLGISVLLAELWTARIIWNSGTSPFSNALMLGAVGLQIPLLINDPLTSLMSSATRQQYVMFVLAGGATSILLLVVAPRAQRLLLAISAAFAFAIGVTVINGLPRPQIDVLQFQTESARALLRGISPYSITFHDPYSAAESAQFYGPGVSVGGVLKFGYPYMPLTLMLALPGYLAGDVRYASLGAVVVASILIARARPSRSSTIAALLLLLTPALPFMVLVAWSDTYVVLLLAAVWYAQCRAPRLVPYVIGLLFASKQYLVIATPLILLLIPRPWSAMALWRFAWRTAAAGSFVTLPFLVWDFAGFMHSVVWLQFRQPFRHDALSYLAWLNPAQPGKWLVLPFLLTGGTVGVLLRGSTRRAVSFPLALGLSMLPFFAFNKQAFFNYYFFILGCVCCAIASESALAVTLAPDIITVQRDETPEPLPLQSGQAL